MPRPPEGGTLASAPEGRTQIMNLEGEAAPEGKWQGKGSKPQEYPSIGTGGSDAVEGIGATTLGAGATPLALTPGRTGGRPNAPPAATIPLAMALDMRVARAPMDKSAEAEEDPETPLDLEPLPEPPGRELPAPELPALGLLTEPNALVPELRLGTVPRILVVERGVEVSATTAARVPVGTVLGAKEKAITQYRSIWISMRKQQNLAAKQTTPLRNSELPCYVYDTGSYRLAAQVNFD
uniref:Uncharacterized protein n=1 Tax=Amphimedon queenslandica TaxID=400682 RepID=A0A1X7UFN9_AMPQE